MVTITYWPVVKADVFLKASYTEMHLEAVHDFNQHRALISAKLINKGCEKLKNNQILIDVTVILNHKLA